MSMFRPHFVALRDCSGVMKRTRRGAVGGQGLGAAFKHACAGEVHDDDWVVSVLPSSTTEMPELLDLLRKFFPDNCILFCYKATHSGAMLEMRLRLISNQSAPKRLRLSDPHCYSSGTRGTTTPSSCTSSRVPKIGVKNLNLVRKKAVMETWTSTQLRTRGSFWSLKSGSGGRRSWTNSQGLSGGTGSCTCLHASKAD